MKERPVVTIPTAKERADFRIMCRALGTVQLRDVATIEHMNHRDIHETIAREVLQEKQRAGQR